MAFLEGFVLPENAHVESKPTIMPKKNLSRNIIKWATIAGALTFGVYFLPRSISLMDEDGKNQLENYKCTEPIEYDEDNFEHEAKFIRWMTGMKIEVSEIVKFMITRKNGVEEVGDEKYLNLPIYSRDICGRLYGVDESKWPK